MSAVLATTSIAPILADPSLRSEQVTQLLLGEGAAIVARQGEMLRVRTLLDGYEGWLHRGYVRETDTGTVEAWLTTAAWSEGATLRVGSASLRAPHRARLPLEGHDRVRLPDGRPATIAEGRIRDYGQVIRDAVQLSPAAWAWREFAGAPYLWGGLTTAGIDCSGLVQVAFLARGMPLPRDARDQVLAGRDVPLDHVAEGDLLFFRDAAGRVTHVAIAAAAATLVHSTVETGQVTHEGWQPGDRAGPLRERLVAVRRLA